MKKLAGFVVVALFIIPSVSSAAALTSEQANSLINVVQSSTTTPASAFVPLITAFSNITENQAISLITVVQSAIGVPADAFVNLLISFTVDPVTPVTTTTTTTETPVFGSTTTTTETPVDKSEIKIISVTKRVANEYQPLGSVLFRVAVLDQDGKYLQMADVSMNAQDAVTTAEYKNGILTAKTNTQSTNNSADWTAGINYTPASTGVKTITFTTGTLTKEYTITIE